MLLNHSTTSFLFLIRLFFVRDVNEKNIYKYRFVFVKKIQKDIRNALMPTFSNDLRIEDVVDLFVLCISFGTGRIPV